MPFREKREEVEPWLSGAARSEYLRMKPAISQQLAEPDHCYVRIHGMLVVHSPSKEPEEFLTELVGQPVRFTRLAAERFCQYTDGAVIWNEPQQHRRRLFKDQPPQLRQRHAP